ncbi:MAG: SPOR domain-containing protein [Betaproteobacteria bacterium]|nr:SPOR domain-containing protein [Betaproteobacteria bacterium]MDH5220719.1 SPOR domain-containing protein [Betaproteobacteria bacterium]MDH5350537.1 SPOR domain-containing protein [Betaproteobacteria bacterium]
MRLFRNVLWASLLALAAPQAQAAAAAVVEGMQMPAWVERNVLGSVRRAPLAPGVELRSGDELRTGAGARLYVRLAEGSVVKLGEKASMRIAELAPDRGGVFAAALNVLEGAFRFTTDVLGKPRRRDVSIRVATVTAGIRGTDLWGKSVPERQVVCLIEGRIEVGAEGEAPVTMDQPRQFYQRDNGRTQPVGFVDPVQLAQWARETEIAEGGGAARRDGKWRLTLARAKTQAAALELYDRLRDAGYAARIHPTMAGDARVYLVQISRLASRADAEALREQLRGMAGVVDPSVSL